MPISIAVNEHNGFSQHYDNDAPAEDLKTLDIRSLGAQEGSKEFEDRLHDTLTSWQSHFNLEQGPIYSVGYLYGYADGSARVYFALHHLVVDTISWRVLVEDLQRLYNQQELGQKGSSYRQWAHAVRDYAHTHEHEKAYWHHVLANSEKSKTQLDNLVVCAAQPCFAEVRLDPEQTKKLLRESNRTYHTQINDILLTALGYALSAVTDSSINHIVLEGHGREEIDASIDVTRTLGWFTTMYPVRLEISDDLGSSLKNIKENLRQIPNKGIGYGPLMGYRSQPLPGISFNYLGQFKKDEPLQGSSIHYYSHLSK